MSEITTHVIISSNKYYFDNEGGYSGDRVGIVVTGWV